MYNSLKELVESPNCNFVKILNWRAEVNSDKKVYIYLKGGEIEAQSITFYELDRQARAIGAYLRRWGMAGERALLLYQSGIEYMAAFFGCLYAGTIAVPLYPPKMNRKMERIKTIIKDSGAVAILSTEQLMQKCKKMLMDEMDNDEIHWIDTDNISLDMAEKWSFPEINEDTIAFLQYTSGSTSNPKGVMVSHKNLIHNEKVISISISSNEKDVIVNWLPLYHDMGLIGNVLKAVYIGATSIIMSPNDFLQKPIRWLKTITRYKASISGGPNFAYNLCISNISDEEKEELDLSSWTIAFNGAEPISSETLLRFYEKFKDCGLSKTAIYPCYGLAEATLFVSGGNRGQQYSEITVDGEKLKENIVCEVDVTSPVAKTLVGCGQPRGGQKVIIVCPETRKECPDGTVGEIWIKGDSVGKGYWNMSEKSNEIFGSYTSDTNDGPFLRTGDLGFIKNSVLYITGRHKDLIIIRGQNHYPQDIEETATKSHPLLISGAAAAFSVEYEGEEKLIIVAELKHDFKSVYKKRGDELVEEILDSIRTNVSEEHQVQVNSIALIKTGSILKTSSGKIQRQACKNAYLNMQFDIWGGWNVGK